MHDWLKALHLIAAIHWIAGMLVAGLALRSWHGRVELLRQVHRWDRWVTTPAMFATWLFGLWMATSAGWFGSGWLMVKLALVVMLSGLHGILSGMLERNAAPGRARYLGIALPVTAASVFGVVALATVKPF